MPPGVVVPLTGWTARRAGAAVMGVEEAVKLKMVMVRRVKSCILLEWACSEVGLELRRVMSNLIGM
jgi:hypothetical protein